MKAYLEKIYSFSDNNLYFIYKKYLCSICMVWVKGGPGASGRVLPPVTGRSRVRVVVSSHYTGEGKAYH